MRIKDVAELAGVSPATVSRVLSESSSVGEAHKEKVLSAVEEVGYRRNRLASNLRKQRAGIIGVVVSDVENPHFSEMVRAVEDAAYRRGYRVLLCNTDEDPEKQSSYLEVLADERALGVIVSSSGTVGSGIQQLLDLSIPVVAFDRSVADPRADAVVADNVGGAERATRLLIGAGHETIGFVGGPKHIETGMLRQQGYESAMAEFGLEPRCADGGFRVSSGVTATEMLLDGDQVGDRPTALIVANNLMTIGALQALRKCSLRVPEDVALVAFDDPPWAALVEPPLTTLGQPVRTMSHRAVELLFERIEGKRTEAVKETSQFELHVRNSCRMAAREQGRGG